MGPETDIVEPVLAGFLDYWVTGWVSGMFVRKICPGMYRESSEPILVQILLLLTVMV